MCEPTANNHFAASDPVDKSIVLAFKSKYLRAEIPNALVADYVRKHPDKLIGFAGIDPTNPAEAIADIREAQDRLGLKGVTISPAGQDFHPADTRHAGLRRSGQPEDARADSPGHAFHRRQQDGICPPLPARRSRTRVPALKLIVAHMGYPWIDRCVVLLGKHPNVFADISGLLHRPWQAFNTLLTAYQYGVMDKLLFGSDFPFTSATAAIEALYSINQFTLGTHMPTVPRQHLRGIVERDALALLGIAPPAPVKREPSSLLSDEEL